jgi:hypothetical protein
MPTAKRTAGDRPIAQILPNGDREWRVDGKLHRPGGKLALEYAQGGGECWLHGKHVFTKPPRLRADWREVHGKPRMIIRPNGDREWRVEGKLHREDGPAVEYKAGGGEWWLHGVNHREDGPAVVFSDGSWAWYRDGRLHRIDGPALFEPGGRIAWFRTGVPHREDGPALCDAAGSRRWALDGELFPSEGEFLEALAQRGEPR